MLCCGSECVSSWLFFFNLFYSMDSIHLYDHSKLAWMGRVCSSWLTTSDVV